MANLEPSFPRKKFGLLTWSPFSFSFSSTWIQPLWPNPTPTDQAAIYEDLQVCNGRTLISDCNFFQKRILSKHAHWRCKWGTVKKGRAGWSRTQCVSSVIFETNCHCSWQLAVIAPCASRRHALSRPDLNEMQNTYFSAQLCTNFFSWIIEKTEEKISIDIFDIFYWSIA